MLHFRKKIALLSACALLSGLMSSPASAEQSLILVRDENGSMSVVFEDTAEPITVWAYSSGLKTISRGEHGEAVQYQTFREGCYVVTTAGGYPEDVEYSAQEIDPESIVWSDGYEDWLSNYPEGARLFQLDYDSVNYAKTLCNTHDTVLDALYLWMDETGNTVFWKGNIEYCALKSELTGYLNVKDGEVFYTNPDGEIIEYLTGEKKEIILKNLQYPTEVQEPVYQSVLSEAARESLASANAVGADWTERYEAWASSVDSETMTPAELEASRKAAGVESDFDMIQKAYTLCEEILSEYGDEFDYVRPAIDSRNREKITTYRPQSIWDEVGDADEDGTVTAKDAAKILERVTSVVSGALYTDREDMERKLAVYDINSDGNINASDAALLLCYVAGTGSGNYATLKEFLKESE